MTAYPHGIATNFVAGKFDLAVLKRAIRLSEVVGRDVQWDARKSRPDRGDHWACCPIHGEKSPSFHVEDTKGRFKCFACGAGGDHIDYLVAITGCQVGQAIAQLAFLAGMAPQATEMPRGARPALHPPQTPPIDRGAQRKAKARRIWEEGIGIANTAAELYLRRKRFIPEPQTLAPELKFQPLLEYELGAVYENGQRITSGPSVPAMIARVDDAAGAFTGLWQVFLTGNGQKADLSPCKVGMGPVKGGAVRLFGLPPDGRIGIAEGIETALAVRALTGMTCWAGLSTSGVMGFEPPAGITHISIFQDGDLWKRHPNTGKWFCPGRQAAIDLKARMDIAGMPCTIEPAPRGGKDYLDVLVALQKHEGAA